MGPTRKKSRRTTHTGTLPPLQKYTFPATYTLEAVVRVQQPENPLLTPVSADVILSGMHIVRVAVNARTFKDYSRPAVDQLSKRLPALAVEIYVQNPDYMLTGYGNSLRQRMDPERACKFLSTLLNDTEISWFHDVLEQQGWSLSLDNGGAS